MAIHSDYERSLPQQIARLGPPAVLSKAGIPCVVYAEDALSIVYHTPLEYFEQQLLVEKHHHQGCRKGHLV